MLQFLLDSQTKFQKRMGVDFDDMTIRERSVYLKEHGYFLMEEVMEMFREMPFHKSWKDYPNWDRYKQVLQTVKIKEDAVDALHFMINIFLALVMGEQEIIEMYKEKNKLNYARQE